MRRDADVLPDAWPTMAPQSLHRVSSSFHYFHYQTRNTYDVRLTGSKTGCLYHQATSHHAQRWHPVRTGLSWMMKQMRVHLYKHSVTIILTHEDGWKTYLAVALYLPGLAAFANSWGNSQSAPFPFSAMQTFTSTSRLLLCDVPYLSGIATLFSASEYTQS